MYFPESAAIVEDHDHLQEIVERVDERLAIIFASSPLRPTDFACVIDADENQVVAVFELLAERDLLSRIEMVECALCDTLSPAADFRRAIEDEDDFECSSCGRNIHRRTQPTILYRMSDAVLARPKPETNDDSARNTSNSATYAFQRSGQYWTLAFQGVTRHLRETLGIVFIANLLAKPDRDISVVELKAGQAGINPVVLTGSSGEMLDDDARKEYQQRIQDIQEELDDARTNSDLARIEKLEGDQESLKTELRKAIGLGGRSRASNDVEKARTSVTNAISRAIESISEKHPDLGRHLTKSISTGITCRYASEPGIEWIL